MCNKWIIKNCVAVLICLSILPGRVVGMGTPEEVVQVYFAALKEGDIASIKNVLSQSFYNKKKVLLERNPRYADFLIRMYENVQIYISNIEIDDDLAYITVELTQVTGGTDEIVLILEKSDALTWKIIQEQFK